MNSLPAKPMFLQIDRTRYSVASFEQASLMFCKARDVSGKGASETPSPVIVDEIGNVIAHISYNGRVWAGPEWVAGDIPLYDNR